MNKQKRSSALEFHISVHYGNAWVSLETEKGTLESRSGPDTSAPGLEADYERTLH